MGPGSTVLKELLRGDYRNKDIKSVILWAWIYLPHGTLLRGDY